VHDLTISLKIIHSLGMHPQKGSPALW